MGKALSGELSCPCDRSCFSTPVISNSLSQSKLSGTRKFTLGYEYFGFNFDFEISRVDCMYVIFIKWLYERFLTAFIWLHKVICSGRFLNIYI